MPPRDRRPWYMHGDPSWYDVGQLFVPGSSEEASAPAAEPGASRFKGFVPGSDPVDPTAWVKAIAEQQRQFQARGFGGEGPVAAPPPEPPRRTQVEEQQDNLGGVMGMIDQIGSFASGMFGSEAAAEPGVEVSPSVAESGVMEVAAAPPAPAPGVGPSRAMPRAAVPPGAVGTEFPVARGTVTPEVYGSAAQGVLSRIGEKGLQLDSTSSPVSASAPADENANDYSSWNSRWLTRILGPGSENLSPEQRWEGLRQGLGAFGSALAGGRWGLAGPAAQSAIYNSTRGYGPGGPNQMDVADAYALNQQIAKLEQRHYDESKYDTRRAHSLEDSRTLARESFDRQQDTGATRARNYEGRMQETLDRQLSEIARGQRKYLDNTVSSYALSRLGEYGERGFGFEKELYGVIQAGIDPAYLAKIGAAGATGGGGMPAPPPPKPLP